MPKPADDQKPDLSEFEAHNHHRTTSHAVDRILDALVTSRKRRDGQRLASLETALRDPNIGHEAIRRVLVSWGFEAPSATHLATYRRERLGVRLT